MCYDPSTARVGDLVLRSTFSGEDVALEIVEKTTYLGVQRVLSSTARMVHNDVEIGIISTLKTSNTQVYPPLLLVSEPLHAVGLRVKGKRLFKRRTVYHLDQ